MKKLILLLFACCIFIFSSSNAQNIIQIPQDAATLSAAVQLAQSGDTIELSIGIYTDSVHISSKDLIFRGNPNGGSVLSPGVNEKSFVLLDSDVEFYHLQFDDFQQNSPPPNFAISATNSNVKINQCRFSNLFSPLSMWWGNLEISSSIFTGTRGNAGIQHNGGTFLMYNNLVYGLDKTAISIGRAHGQFFNNTMVGSTPTQHYGLIINSDSISHIYNNIFDGFGVGIQLAASDSAELAALRIYNNNIYNAAAPYWYEYNESLSLPIYSGALTPNPGTGEISSSSYFVDSANGDFRILSTSPCINTGTDAYPFPVDFDLNGNDRIVGTAPDIGAYEYYVVAGLEEESLASAIHLFPNPTSGDITLALNNSNLKLEQLEIFDAVGSLVLSKQLSATENRLSLNLSTGLYLVRIKTDVGLVTKRLVVQ